MARPKKDGHEHPVDRKIRNLGKAARAGDEETVNAEADELPKDEDGNYIIP
jgi:hypothetical protein